MLSGSCLPEDGPERLPPQGPGAGRRYAQPRRPARDRCPAGRGGAARGPGRTASRRSQAYVRQAV